MLAERHEKILVYLRGFELPATVQIPDIANAAGYANQKSRQGTSESSGAASAMIKLRKIGLIDYETKPYQKGYIVKRVSPDSVETFGDVVFEPNDEPEQDAISDAELVPYVEGHSMVSKGERVMFDSDVGRVYGVSTKEINQAKTRNPKKFVHPKTGEPFAWQLSDVEIAEFRSQAVTKIEMRGRGGENPWVYNREGINMHATILSSDEAILRAIQIVTTFSDLERMAHGEEPKQPGFAEMMQAVASGFGVVRQDINQLDTRMDTFAPELKALEVANDKLCKENERLNIKVSFLNADAEKYKNEATRRRMATKIGELGRIEIKLLRTKRFSKYWEQYRRDYSYKVAETPYDECIPIFHEIVQRIKTRIESDPDTISLLSDDDKNFLITSGAWGNFDGTEIPVRVSMAG